MKKLMICLGLVLSISGVVNAQDCCSADTKTDCCSSEKNMIVVAEIKNLIVALVMYVLLRRWIR